MATRLADGSTVVGSDWGAEPEVARVSSVTSGNHSSPRVGKRAEFEGPGRPARLDEDVGAFSRGKKQLRYRVGLVEQPSIGPDEVHLVRFQCEFVEARIAPVDEAPALDLAALGLEPGIHLAVDHDDVPFLPEHVVHHHGVRRRR